MEQATIQVPVDVATATAFAALPPEQQEQVGKTLALWLNNPQNNNSLLLQVMEQLQATASANGLTQEILDDLLADA